MKYLLDTNVIYDLSNQHEEVTLKGIFYNRNEAELFISPMTIEEILYSTKPIDLRRDAAKYLNSILDVQVFLLPDIVYTFAKHYNVYRNKKIHDILTSALKQSLDSFVFWDTCDYLDLQKFDDDMQQLKELYREKTQQWFEIADSAKERILQMSETGKIKGDKLKMFRYIWEKLSSWLILLLNSLVVSKNISISYNSLSPPNSIIHFYKITLAYMYDMIDQGTKPKYNDYVDVCLFIYCHLFVDKIITSEGKMKRIAEYAECSELVETPLLG